MSDLEEFREMGPIDWLLIEFDQPLTGNSAQPIHSGGMMSTQTTPETGVRP